MNRRHTDGTEELTNGRAIGLEVGTTAAAAARAAVEPELDLRCRVRRVGPVVQEAPGIAREPLRRAAPKY